jgi:hypothetical protein
MRRLIVTLLFSLVVACENDEALFESDAGVQIAAHEEKLISGQFTFVNSDRGASMSLYTNKNLVRAIVMAAEQNVFTNSSFTCEVSNPTSASCKFTWPFGAQDPQPIVYSVFDCRDAVPPPGAELQTSCQLGLNFSNPGTIQFYKNGNRWWGDGYWITSNTSKKIQIIQSSGRVEVTISTLSR